MTKTGINVKYSTGTLEWLKNELLLRDPHDLKERDRHSTRSRFFGMDWYAPTCFAIEILDAKYEKVQIKDVVNPLEYLSTQQKADLKQVLSEFTKLFDSTLGVYPHKKFHIELEPGAKPRHARPYPVPVIHLKTLKKELIHFCEICVCVCVCV